jgi:ATP-dependent protease Clp ATPase subunit
VELAVEKYKVADEPYYLPVKQEVELFEAAYAARLPVMLKGPPGCGKTRFVEYMAYKMNRPLITTGRSPPPLETARSATWTRWSRRARTRW